MFNYLTIETFKNNKTMYNNRQNGRGIVGGHGGIYTIRSDMGYDNKMMLDAMSSDRHPNEQVVLSLESTDRRDFDVKKPKKTTTSNVNNGGGGGCAGGGGRRRSCRSLSNCKFTIFTDILLFIIVAAVCGVVELGLIETPVTGYYCKDPSLSHPFKGDTVSNVTLFLVTLLLPLTVIVGVELCHGCIAKTKITKRDIFNWYRELIVGAMFSLLIVEIAKLIIGEHRPHFLETCAPDTENHCQSGSFVYSYKCTNNDLSHRIIVDSSRSFPSGHSSISWFVGFYLAAYVHYRFDTKRVGIMVKPFLMVVCLMWSVVCSLSRITDRRHHWHDVLVGTIFGIVFAIYYVTHVTRKFRSSYERNKSSSINVDGRFV